MDRPFLSLLEFVAIEDYAELLKWLLLRRSSTTADQEIDAMRLAAFFGSQNAIDLFLSVSHESMFLSSRVQRIHAAILGAAGAGNVSALEYFSKRELNSLPSDSNSGGRRQGTVTPLEEMSDAGCANPNVNCVSSEAVALSAVHGYLACTEKASVDYEAVIRWLFLNTALVPSSFLSAAQIILKDSCEREKWERARPLLELLLSQLDLDPFESFDVIDALGMCLYNHATRVKDLRKVALAWFAFLAQSGVDIQRKKLCGLVPDRKSTMLELDAPIQELQTKQRSSWAGFDVLKLNHSMQAIQKAVAENPSLLKLRDHGGVSLTHLAAACNRLDVVEWLVERMGQDLASVDNMRRSVIDVAKASGSSSVVAWIEARQSQQVISRFLSLHVRRRLASKKLLLMKASIVRLQAWVRGVFISRYFRGQIRSRLEASKEFHSVWSRALNALRGGISAIDSVWSLTRENLVDMKYNESSYSDEMLDDAMLSALNDETLAGDYNEAVLSGATECCAGGDDHLDTVTEGDEEYCVFEDFESSLHAPVIITNRVLLTNDVLKWCRKGDEKYVGFFLRRVEQLATGARSRILAKRLTGAFKVPIFESYLEQQSGHRILWTLQASGDVLIWYVVKHKEVSRFAKLIDSSLGRSERQHLDGLSTLGLISEESNERAPVEEIILDPLGNTPLKLYTVTSEDVQSLSNASWTPPLRLTPPEREVVEAPGTTLVLGRSGTGKTICLCNKMDFDRHVHCDDDEFTQLFVTRSVRLSRLVKSTVGDDGKCHFRTFQDLLSAVENSLSATFFLPSQRVDFARFKRDFYRDAKVWGGVDALVAWTNIRSFIKGSIESLSSPERTLPCDNYISADILGKRRCRLSQELRPEVYNAFRAYRKYLEENGLWDDCDRVSSLLTQLQVTKDTNLERFELLRYSKIYVDEVQDYTQAELLLFFYLSRSGDLFLCGDPAQSVAEGVEFRFDEIRSVAHFVAGPDRRHLIPQKPMTLNVNFRSHSGILNVAAAVLSRMFKVFPDSAKQLNEDRGLFLGPRPGVLYKADAHLLNGALATVLNGSTILVHDEHKLRSSHVVDDYRLLYGIREAKGLEFKGVIVLDFFSGIPAPLQKPWRDLLLGREGPDFAPRFPEVEGHLKLLYTAITRSIDRLWFVETKPSPSGEAFCRWLTTTTVSRLSRRDGEPLAVRQRVSDVEALRMSADEWLLAGLENAEAAEGAAAATDLDAADSFLQKAIHCFEQSDHPSLAAKARAQLSSVRFRSRLTQQENVRPDRVAEADVTGVVSDLETSTAQLLLSLFREGLWLEASHLCQTALPHLPVYTQGRFRADVLPKLLPSHS